MNLETWFLLPSADWAGSLVSLSVAIVSAGAALYSAAVVPWAADLESARRAGMDGAQRLNPAGDAGSRARLRLIDVRARDPRRGLGLVALLIATPMAVLGVIAALQIPDSGWLYTVVPVAVACIVALIAAFIPGATERREADRLLRAWSDELSSTTRTDGH